MRKICINNIVSDILRTVNRMAARWDRIFVAEMDSFAQFMFPISGQIHLLGN